MPMRHAHARVHRASLFLAVYARTVHACAHVPVPLVMNTKSQCDAYLQGVGRVCVCVWVCVCVGVCVCVSRHLGVHDTRIRSQRYRHIHT